MRPYILQETTWKTIKERKYEIALLPWGATEPHNLHLPYGTDTLETTRIAEEAAAKAWQEGCFVMVLPTIPLGVQNPGQIELPFCLHTRPSTQFRILSDVIHDLYGQGIHKIVLLNGHGGNDFKSFIRELQPDYPGMFIGLVEWFSIFNNSDFFEEPGDHAGEMETSIMLHYFPEMILPLENAGDGSSKKFIIEALEKKVAWTPRQWDKISRDTGAGNPEKATPQKGKKFLDKLTGEIAKFLTELGKAGPTDIYEA